MRSAGNIGVPGDSPAALPARHVEALLEPLETIWQYAESGRDPFVSFDPAQDSPASLQLSVNAHIIAQFS
jgi:hypothetical protein